MSEAEREKYVAWWLYESGLQVGELIRIAMGLDEVTRDFSTRGSASPDRICFPALGGGVSGPSAGCRAAGKEDRQPPMAPRARLCFVVGPPAP